MSTVVAAAQPAAAGGHLWHVVTTLAFLVGSLLAVAVGEHLSRRRLEARDRARLSRSLLVGIAAACAAAAGVVHVTVIPEHFEEAALYGTFFTVTAACQLLYAAALAWRPSRALLTMGVAGNVTLIALWLFTRLVAVPLGPGAGETESFGGLDILASSLEVTFLVAAMSVLVAARARGARAVTIAVSVC